MRIKSSRHSVFLAVLIVVTASIFLADTLTDYAVAVAGFYTAVILAAAAWWSARALVTLAATCTALTLISFVLSGHGHYQVGLVNSAISIVAIAATTYLALKIDEARAETHLAQAQLLRIARTSTLGELTTSIAHEVNQPLAAIVTSGNACLRWLDQVPANLDKARTGVGRIVADAQRASEVIARIRSLTRGEQPYRSHFDLNEAVLEMLSLSRAELQRGKVELDIDLANDLPLVYADRIQVQQVVGNLVLNAIEAMAKVSGGPRRLRIASEGHDAGVVRLRVADSGPGIPDDSAGQLFDPFWTTKPGGLGLGLSISRSIVEANGGRIWLDPPSADGRSGASLQFELPVATHD